MWTIVAFCGPTVWLPWWVIVLLWWCLVSSLPTLGHSLTLKMSWSWAHIFGVMGSAWGSHLSPCIWQRVSREWAEHSSQLEEQQVPVWHSAVDTNMTGHEHIRWRGTKGLQGMGEHQLYRVGRVHRAVSLLQVLSGALQDLGMGMWQQAGVAWLGKKVSTSATAFLLPSLYMCAPWLG